MPRIALILCGAVLALGLAVSPAFAQPIAVAEGEQAGVRIEIDELQRASGGTVMLKFTVINDGRQAFDLPYALRSFGDVSLIDFAGRLKYLPVSERGQCLCSEAPGKLDAGATASLWARFPAPPQAVKEVSVVFPGFFPVDDVPISG